MSTNFSCRKPPREIWLIHDPLDGPHLFRTKKEADEMMQEWEKEAADQYWDSFWDMLGPIRYIRADEPRRIPSRVPLASMPPKRLVNTNA